MLGFCWFSQGRGHALAPVWSAGGQPPCCSPQCLSVANLSTAGRYHGDHSWAGLHGYSGTLAVGWGAAADGWGYPAILGQVGWGAADQAGAAGHGPAGWGQNQVGEYQVMGNSWRMVCHCCQPQGAEHLLPALSEACSFPTWTGTKTQPH